MTQVESNPNWKKSLELFFSSRASSITGNSFEEFCFVSGRDHRLWSMPNLYENLINDIVNLLDANLESRILEVGCATGFIAKDLCLKVSYTGIDLSPKVIAVAKRLIPDDAEFAVNDGSDLSFPENSFDGVFCYDVFTNFPQFSEGEKIIEEMLRVVKPGGKILLGSIPDIDTKKDFLASVEKTMNELNDKFGSPKVFEVKKDNLMVNFLRLFKRSELQVKPEIICYYFSKSVFQSFGEKIGADCKFFNIDKAHPYYGFRFNVVYTKPLI